MKTLVCMKKSLKESQQRRLSRLRQMLMALGLVFSLALGQPSAVHAQAQALAPLIQMGVQLAQSVAPMILPMAVTGAIMGARAAAMTPAYIKAKIASMPRPHLRRKKLADAEASTGQPVAQDEVTENVSGQVIEENGAEEGAEKSAKAPVETQPPVPRKQSLAEAEFARQQAEMKEGCDWME